MAIIWVNDELPQELGEKVPDGLKCFCDAPATTVFYGASKLPVCYLCETCNEQWSRLQS